MQRCDREPRMCGEPDEQTERQPFATSSDRVADKWKMRCSRSLLNLADLFRNAASHPRQLEPIASFLAMAKSAL